MAAWRGGSAGFWEWAGATGPEPGLVCGCPLRRRGRGSSRVVAGLPSPISALPLCLGSRLPLGVAARLDRAE